MLTDEQRKEVALGVQEKFRMQETPRIFLHQDDQGIQGYKISFKNRLEAGKLVSEGFGVGVKEVFTRAILSGVLYTVFLTEVQLQALQRRPIAQEEIESEAAEEKSPESASALLKRVDTFVESYKKVGQLRQVIEREMNEQKSLSPDSPLYREHGILRNIDFICSEAGPDQKFSEVLAGVLCLYFPEQISDRCYDLFADLLGQEIPEIKEIYCKKRPAPGAHPNNLFTVEDARRELNVLITSNTTTYGIFWQYCGRISEQYVKKCTKETKVKVLKELLASLESREGNELLPATDLATTLQIISAKYPDLRKSGSLIKLYEKLHAACVPEEQQAFAVSNSGEGIAARLLGSMGYNSY